MYVPYVYVIYINRIWAINVYRRGRHTLSKCPFNDVYATPSTSLQESPGHMNEGVNNPEQPTTTTCRLGERYVMRHDYPRRNGFNRDEVPESGTD